MNEALTLALEILKAAYVPADLDEQREKAITELEALAQPEQDLVEKLKSVALQSYAIGYKDAQSGDKMQLAQPERTGWPAGLLQDDDRKLSKWLASKPDAKHVVDITQPERPWVGLTDEQIMLKSYQIGGLFDDLALNYQADDVLTFARAIEAAHNIKERNT